LPLIKRIVRVGVVAAIVAGLAGWTFERARLGASDEAALRRVEAELRERFDATAATLGSMAARVAADPAAAEPGPYDQAALGRLFDIASSVVPADDTGRAGVSLYDSVGQPTAWAGRVSDLPKERVLGPATLLIAPGALGPRLIRVAPFVPSRAEPLDSVDEFHVALSTPEMARVVHSCDVMLAPVFGLAAAEAMAAGLAVVLANADDDGEAFGERLIDVLDDDDVRAALRAKGKADAEAWRSERAAPLLEAML